MVVSVGWRGSGYSVKYYVGMKGFGLSCEDENQRGLLTDAGLPGK